MSTRAAPGAEVEPRGGTALVLAELLALERELCELEYLRRADALERAGDAVRHLGELAVNEAILARAAAELGTSSEFGRVLISEVVEGSLRPLAIWAAHEPATADVALAELSGDPIALEYPLLEHELLRRRGGLIVDVAAAGGRTPAILAGTLGWSSYVVAPLSVGGETIGLLHADKPGAGAVDALDAEVAAKLADGLSGVLERAVLRHTLELHRAELESAVQWMSGRLGRLGDATALEAPAVVDEAAWRLADSLTPRELDVLRLLSRGHTNLAIANALVVREGTVKYHVKNILRKLGASSRADAVSRFVRATAAGAPQ
jgi:DNA-binding CsgD family transcriptional regulator